MNEQLDFEKPLIEIQEKVNQLKEICKTNPRRESELKKLKKKLVEIQEEIYSKLTPWQVTQLARHSARPNTSDYIEMMFEQFTELHGDRLYGDDKSIITGIARLEGRSIIIIGHQKGKGMKDRIATNFGMPHPEGYRKALRVMRLAEKFNKPIITFVDTPGAYPGVKAEERGQSEAIARNLLVMSQLSVPIISVVIGEGGSGGALAISVADQILMLQYSVYSVISPEGCAAILWNDTSKTSDAAEMLKLTALDLKKLGIIETIIPEPVGGAHRDPAWMAAEISRTLCKQLSDLDLLSPEERLEQRYKKLRSIGEYSENDPAE